MKYSTYKLTITWLTKEIVDFITQMCSLQNNLNVLLWDHNKSLKHNKASYPEEKKSL